MKRPVSEYTPELLGKDFINVVVVTLLCRLIMLLIGLKLN